MAQPPIINARLPMWCLLGIASKSHLINSHKDLTWPWMSQCHYCDLTTLNPTSQGDLYNTVIISRWTDSMGHSSCKVGWNDDRVASLRLQVTFLKCINSFRFSYNSWSKNIVPCTQSEVRVKLMSAPSLNRSGVDILNCVLAATGMSSLNGTSASTLSGVLFLPVLALSFWLTTSGQRRATNSSLLWAIPPSWHPLSRGLFQNIATTYSQTLRPFEIHGHTSMTVEKVFPFVAALPATRGALAAFCGLQGKYFMAMSKAVPTIFPSTTVSQ